RNTTSIVSSNLSLWGKAMSKWIPIACLALIGLGAGVLAYAGDDYGGLDGYEEYGQHIHDSQTVSPLGDDFFGDSTNLYNGQTSFEVTDVSIPGNSSLPVALSRHLAIADQREMIQGGDGLHG